MNVTLDSLRKSNHTISMFNDINLSDQLFRYGIRINPVLIQDIQSALIPINTSRPGETPQIVPVPWLFSPLLYTSMNHPITRNLNVIKTDFASSIDTVGNHPEVTREILLQTGYYSRELQTPVYISLSQVNEKQVREDFQKSFIPVAVSLEGIFQSAFANRPIPQDVKIKSSDILYTSKHVKMLVVSDGDIIRNDVRLRHSASPQVIPLGFDEISNQTFGNKQFILNAINYLTDDSGWMALRNRYFELRLLDKEKLSRELNFWKIINMTVPIVIIILLGIIVPLWRRRSYGK
jgi:ABC-2 type transport system permease protein